MTGGSVDYYPFPDDGSQTLHRVISRLPERDFLALSWRPSTDWLLKVSPGLARALAGMGVESAAAGATFPPPRPACLVLPMAGTDPQTPWPSADARPLRTQGGDSILP